MALYIFITLDEANEKIGKDMLVCTYEQAEIYANSLAQDGKSVSWGKAV